MNTDILSLMTRMSKITPDKAKEIYDTMEYIILNLYDQQVKPTMICEVLSWGIDMDFIMKVLKDNGKVEK